MRRGVISVALTGSFILSLIIAVVSVYLVVTLKNWGAKLIFFILALGASNTVAGIYSLDANLVLFINTALFLVAGFSSVKLKGTGGRVLGIVLIIMGVALFLLFVNGISPTTPGTVWNAIAESAKGGVSLISGFLHQLLGFGTT